MALAGAALVAVLAGGLTASGPAMAAAPPTGTLVAWGSNNGGQLGNGTTTNAAGPVAVSLPSGVQVTSAAAGSTHTLAITSAGSMLAWGTNSLGQLGNGTQTSTTTPVPVTLPAGTSVTQASAGTSFSLAVTSAGGVLAWGGNGNGQLGDGTSTTRLTPVSVHLPSGTTVTQVSAGTAFSLALTSTGQVLAWGANSSDQLGNGSTNRSSTPVPVAIPSGVTVTEVAAGGTFGLALTSSGQVLAWGTGALGTGATSSATPVFVTLPSGDVVTQIAAGGTTGYGALSGGGILAWGDGTAGQLGNSTTTSSATPVTVTAGFGGGTLAAIAAGAQSAVALDAHGNVLTWGTGALGTGGSTATSSSPVHAALPAGEVGAAIVSGSSASFDLALLTSPPPPVEPTLTCQLIASGGQDNGDVSPASPNGCTTTFPAPNYVVEWQVQNAATTPSWTVPSGTEAVAGCTVGETICEREVHAIPGDQTFSASVATEDSAGNPVTLTETATIPAVCGSTQTQIFNFC
jgi:alpha-tubulin suppressor-like RCC1 family protein